MSYQFEDESALEELLNQQLDKRKQQQVLKRQIPSSLVSATRPVSSAGNKSSDTRLTNSPAASNQLRPGTASLGLGRQTTVIEREGFDTQDVTGSSSSQPKGKLSSWLQRDGGNKPAIKETNNDDKTKIVNTRQQQQQQQRRDSLVSSAPKAQNELYSFGSNLADQSLGANLDTIPSEPELQEMSKQRLVQVILEQIVPAMQSLHQDASKQSAQEVERLTEELQMERNRFQALDMRYEEKIKLEEQKWTQITKQLESRLEMSENELSRLMDSQREHLDRLDEQYQKNMARLSENYEQKLRDEKTRFEEAIKMREEMHKIELDSKLNVNFDLVKLDTVQAEWKKSLELTIKQLNDQFKSVESLLDKQALQVDRTNSDLTKRTKQLCEHYDKYEESNARLNSLASSLDELMPKFSAFQQNGQSVLVKACEKLDEFSEKTSVIYRKDYALEETRQELDKLKNQLHKDRLQLTLDSSRISLKEERLNELIKLNSECELKLNNERSQQIEERAHIQTKQVHLDEKANELREQNYGLHLMRKQLTSQKEELIKAQLVLDNDKKTLKSQRALAIAERQKLVALSARIEREVDQLRRLQGSLVCTLCMNRLFGGNNQSIEPTTLLNSELLMQSNSQNQQAETTLGRLVARAKAAGRMGDSSDNQQRVMPASDLLEGQKKQADCDTSLLADETKYVELLSATN